MSNENSDKRKQIRAYFFPLKKSDAISQNILACFLWVIGLPLLIAWGFGLVVWLAATGRKGLGYYGKQLEKWGLKESDLTKLPSSKQIDQWLDEDLEAVIDLALNKLGLVREEVNKIRPPMVIYGPLLWSTIGIPDDEIVVAKDSNKTLRFSCYQLVVVCLTESRISVYSANFNFLRNVFVSERVVEFLYQDIVSVSTEEIATNYTLPDGQVMRRAQIFRLAVPGGDNFEVVVSSPEIRYLLGGEPKLTNHVQSVNAIRELWRSKKKLATCGNISRGNWIGFILVYRQSL